MKKVYVVTEGAIDEEMLRKILPKDLVSQTEFVIGNGRYSAQSLARSILSAKKSPVALVIDADTTEHSAIEEQEEFLNEILGQASAGTPFGVFLAVPTIEILLVETPEVLAQLSHHKLTANEIELAKLRPKKYLTDLLGEENGKQTINKAFKKISKESLSNIRKHPLIEGISQFLSSSGLANG